LKAARECVKNLEVIRKKYRPWNEGDVTIILRLEEFEGESDSIHMSKA